MKFIKVSESFSEIGQITDCFFSFFFIKGQLYSVHRRHRLFSQDNWPKKESDNLSQIVLTEYLDKNPKRVLSEETLCSGNDPRVVSNGEKAYVLSQGAVHSDKVYTLTLLPEKKNILPILGVGVEPGKNWQPFLKRDELYVIDSIVPFSINKVDITTGVISKTEEASTDFNLKARHDNYAILRGGANAMFEKETIYGWGHATTKPYTHIPFIWEFYKGHVSTSFIQMHSAFKEEGYNIVDPTSFFVWDEDHFALGLSCSQRDWFHPQWFMNCIVLINKNDFYVKRFSPLKIESSPKSFFFHTTDLDSLIPSSHHNGGRYNEGHKGCLVCGPSKEINLTKKWTIELCYSSKNKPSKCVGNFDILLNLNGVEKQVAKTKIFGTNGEAARIKLSFQDTSGINKALIQTRVFTLKKVSVTAYFFELTNEE